MGDGVIPAKAGIHAEAYPGAGWVRDTTDMDPGLRRDDAVGGEGSGQMIGAAPHPCPLPTRGRETMERMDGGSRHPLSSLPVEGRVRPLGGRDGATFAVKGAF
ncbi:hypothetical protein GCM10007913_21150 [Devosia yakushimensis]|uniref:Uncharacterized protein n=1 Tax=Devosia yakushimensis TaxID=470028 RepID=A0ABQ5UEW7_9HYPH|nr:hypothetical protein GCM10007913_21150 [Devosia yakushimensis]